MNDSDVFRKTDLGRKEVKSQSLGILPRDARTLLIMIDGKRSYRSYLDTLDSSKMFASFGGVTPIFELLLELEYIEVAGADTATTQTPIASQSQLSPQPTTTDVVTELDRTFRSKAASKMSAIGRKSIGSLFKNKMPYASYETIKSDLAAYIERHAPPVEAWGYLLMLEQCEGSRQLLVLVQEIQSTSSGELAHGMNDFTQRIQY
jgi:hypothetical protein